MPQGAGFSGDRGGQIKRGPRRSLRRGKEPCSSRKPSSFWTKDERRKTKDEKRKTAVGRQRRGGRSALFPQQRPRSGAGLLSARPAGLASAPANAAAAALAAPAAAAAGASALFHGAQGQRGPQGQKPQDHSRSHGAQSRPASWNTPQAQSQATAHCSRETPAAFQPESSSRRTAAMAAMQGV